MKEKAQPLWLCFSTQMETAFLLTRFPAGSRAKQILTSSQASRESARA
jgi:hypothetical protein